MELETHIREKYSSLLPPEFREDREQTLIAVKKHGVALYFASEALRDDETIVRAACTSGEYTIHGEGWKTSVAPLRFASERLREDYDVVLEAVKAMCYSLQYAAEKFRDDRKIVLAALHGGVGFPGEISQSSSLMFASPRLRRDPDILREAIEVNPLALEYANPEQQDDKDFVMKIVKRDGLALQFASRFLRADTGINMAAVKQNPMALQYTQNIIIETVVPSLEPELILEAAYGLNPDKKDLVADIKSMRQDEVWTDATIILDDGTELKTHKFILAARSRVLSAALRTELNAGEFRQSGTLRVEDCSKEAAELFLHFLYHGELPSGWCKRRQDEAKYKDLLRIADFYQVVGLQELLSRRGRRYPWDPDWCGRVE